jgi:lipoprotein-releasing system permease protein
LSPEYFISKRLITTKNNKSSISAPIIKIAISAIAIGMIMMIVSVATGTGLQTKIREKVAAFNGHIIISNYDNNQSEVSTTPLSTQQDFYPKFKKVAHINHVQAVASKAGIIRTATEFEGILFKGVGKEYQWKNINEYLISGRLPNVAENLNEEVLVSEYLSKRLHLKVGSKFSTYFMKETANKLPNQRVFKVVGIYNSGFQDFDATYIIGDIRHIQRINKWQPNQVGAFEVFIDDFTQIQQKGKEVYEQTSSRLNTQTIVEKYSYIFDWLALFDFNIQLIIIIMILVSTINMAVALLVLILERTQMIGILKAIGANNWTIRKIFLYNAAHLIFRGLLWGNAIGIGLLLIQKYFQPLRFPNPEQYYCKIIPVEINPLYLVLLNAGTIVLCLLLLLIPSYIITKISPVKALRFD